ncbi:D-alanyl-D-alanine carboxypeptidase family protein [Tepidamorphus sp. 3E244]|uniref:D-alanyl-D-alanine carboxypeptidase family protein n=1 Tax=Tepidamorphus sp. 3E244 TaxID=3385498 RepID=UPI0038FCB660
MVHVLYRAFACARRIALIVFLGFAGQVSQSIAQPFETSAPYAFLLDVDTGSVLLDKQSTERMPPSSMAKLMTMAVVFDMLKDGQLSLEDEFIISEDAWRRGGAVSGGSTMFAELNSSIALKDLIPGVVVMSGNDASIAIAEGLAGSEQGFARVMNAKAREIGLENSNFTNATGLPDEEMYVTARDLAKVALYIIENHPEFYKYYAMEDFTWNGVRQRNRNPLLSMSIGADGLKTGYTGAAGYGLVGSAVQDDRRLIVVVNGLKSTKDRAQEAQKLLAWGLRAFDKAVLFDEGVAAGSVSVYGGEISRLPVAGKGPINLLVPKGSQPDLRARIVYQGPVDAPVRKGARIAKLRIFDGDSLLLETPLYAQQDVEVGPLHSRALDAALALFKQLLRQVF